MSAIAYITDPNMLAMHRLSANRTMNFWRLSTKLAFSDFGVGDLVFFLSKDKEHSKDKEKGLVGFGRVTSMNLKSPLQMWNEYKSENGFSNKELFFEALKKLSKDHKLPDKMSSFYLENVVFFQEPLFLSEYDINISNSIESYIYIRPEETVIKLLEEGKNSLDIWSSSELTAVRIQEEAIATALNLAYKQVGELPISETLLKKAYKTLCSYQKIYEPYRFINNCRTALYLSFEDNVEIVVYADRIDKRILIGHARLINYYLKMYYPRELRIFYKTSNRDKELEELLNNC